MIVTPMVRNNIFLNAHPAGCEAELKGHIARLDALSPRKDRSPLKNALIIGCSTGYGLASREVAAFRYGAGTVGFSFEKAPSPNKTGSPGWYANKAFDRHAEERGLFSLTFDMDAFSHQAKITAIETAKQKGITYDLVIYSLASPVRVDPDTGVMYRSVIKPIGRDYAGMTSDVFSGKLTMAQVQAADESEIQQTVKVMGGQDWELWISALEAAKVLSSGCTTLAYSYLGPPMSWPIYRDGTIGKAKEDLERAAKAISSKGIGSGLRAFVSINKAVVTRASAIIPIIPLYVSTLFKVMKERKIHEDCLDQSVRLFAERLYRGKGVPVPVDTEGRIRLDELEMGQAVQAEVQSRLAKVNESNLDVLTDIEGFRNDFLRAHGFGVPGVDYSADVDTL
ncbi:MAG: reductase [Spirochaetes bacterium]|nr:MAG: reductase [Spirochaetota bacterium]